jgi:hypothetical protein
MAAGKYGTSTPHYLHKCVDGHWEFVKEFSDSFSAEKYKKAYRDDGVFKIFMSRKDGEKCNS